MHAAGTPTADSTLNDAQETAANEVAAEDGSGSPIPGVEFCGLVLTKLARFVVLSMFSVFSICAPSRHRVGQLRMHACTHLRTMLLQRLTQTAEPKSLSEITPHTHSLTHALPFTLSVELTLAEVAEFDVKLAAISSHRPQYLQNMRAAIGKAGPPNCQSQPFPPATTPTPTSTHGVRP